MRKRNNQGSAAEDKHLWHLRTIDNDDDDDDDDDDDSSTNIINNIF